MARMLLNRLSLSIAAVVFEKAAVLVIWYSASVKLSINAKSKTCLCMQYSLISQRLLTLYQEMDFGLY